MLAALATSFLAPSLYSSQKVFPVITTDTTVKGLAASGGQDAFSREYLGSIIEREDLYPRDRGQRSLDGLVAEMRRNIHVRVTPVASSGEWKGFEGLSFLPIKDGTLAPFDISVQFDYVDPRIAQRVDAELVRYLLSWPPGGHSAYVGGPNPWAPSSEGSNLYLRSGASFPKKPDGLSRIKLTAIGLLMGLAGGLGVAAVVGWRTGCRRTAR
jgi:hypothetical protein